MCGERDRREAMTKVSDELPVATSPEATLPTQGDDLPVVARLIVEVRSNGFRTVARGAMEDASTGARAAVEAAGSTPLELALGLAKSLFAAPWLRDRIGRAGVRRLLKR